MSKITIWIATKITNPQRLEYFYECLDAILHQSSKDWELIISDDNSTIEIDWERYEYPNVYIYHQNESLWIFKNFNFCLQKTTTEYFFPLWDDDLMDANFIAKVIEYFEKNNKETDILCFNFECMKSNWETYTKSNIKKGFQEKWNISLNKTIEESYKWGFSSMHFHSVGKTESLKKIWWYPDYGMVTDWLLNYVFPLSFHIDFLEDYLIKIRHHENNLWWIDNVDKLRMEKIRLNSYIETEYFQLLNKENQKKFLQQKENFTKDHINLLIQFKQFWRIRGIKEFLSKPITSRNMLIFIFWIIYWKQIHKYFTYFTKHYNRFSYLILSYLNK